MNKSMKLKKHIQFHFSNVSLFNSNTNIYFKKREFQSTIAQTIKRNSKKYKTRLKFITRINKISSNQIKEGFLKEAL